MRVEFSDSQASDQIYGASSTLRAGGYRDPIYNEWICASLAQQGNYLDCGYVADAFLSYTVSGYTVYGGDATGINASGGDSGSPIFVPVGNQAIGIGVMSTSAERFALLAETLPIWGATIY